MKKKKHYFRKDTEAQSCKCIFKDLERAGHDLGTEGALKSTCAFIRAVKLRAKHLCAMIQGFWITVTEFGKKYEYDLV